MRERVMKKSLLVLAVTAVMLFAMSITSMAATATKVTGLKQTVGYETSVKVSWTADPYADGYYVYLSTNNSTFTRQSTSTYPDAYSAEDTISGLSAGQKYYVKVAAVYKDANYNYTAGPLSDAISVVTAPKQVDRTTIKQTKATTTSVSLKWTYSVGASGYVVTVGDKSVTVGGASATVKQSAGDYNTAKVQAYKQSNEGFKAYAYSSSSSDYMYSAPTTPKNVASGKLGNLKWYPTESNKVRIAWNMASGYSSTVSGYQVQIYSIDGKKKLKTYTIKDKSTMLKEFNLKAVKNTGFRVRVRAYKTINGKNYFGKWSSFKGVVPQAAVKITKRTGKTSFKVTWPKVKNVTKYYVYVCKNENVSQSNQVWKKVATLGKNATSYTAKNLKAGNYNAIYIIPVVKAGGKTYKAEYTWYKYAYLSTYY